MNYQIGDQVIHSSHGPGKIIAIDEKSLAGRIRRYYVVDTGHLSVWVVIDEMGEKSIRPPTGSFEFKKLLNTLHSPSQGLPDQHFERKNHLIERMQTRDLAKICLVIRDLISRSRLHNLNLNDRNVLKLAETYLVDEWVISLGTARLTALIELEVLLRGDEETKQASIT